MILTGSPPSSTVARPEKGFQAIEGRGIQVRARWSYQDLSSATLGIKRLIIKIDPTRILHLLGISHLATPAEQHKPEGTQEDMISVK